MDLIVAALASVGLAILVRLLPWPQRLLDARAPAWLGGKTLREKPIECVCMVGWGALAVMIALRGLTVDLDWIITWLAAWGGGSYIWVQVFPPSVEL